MHCRNGSGISGLLKGSSIFHILMIYGSYSSAIALIQGGCETCVEQYA